MNYLTNFFQWQKSRITISISAAAWQLMYLFKCWNVLLKVVKIIFHKIKGPWKYFFGKTYFIGEKKCTSHPKILSTLWKYKLYTVKEIKHLTDNGLNLFLWHKIKFPKWPYKVGIYLIFLCWEILNTQSAKIIYQNTWICGEPGRTGGGIDKPRGQLR